MTFKSIDIGPHIHTQSFCQNPRRWVSLVRQRLLTLPEHMSSSPGFLGSHCISLVVCVVFCTSLFVSFVLCFSSCYFCPSIYGFWLIPSCHQTFHNNIKFEYAWNNKKPSHKKMKINSLSMTEIRLYDSYGNSTLY